MCRNSIAVNIKMLDEMQSMQKIEDGLLLKKDAIFCNSVFVFVVSNTGVAIKHLDAVCSSWDIKTT